MSDLIERLESMKTENCCDSDHHRPWEDDTLDDAIAALSPTMPEDMSNLVERVQAFTDSTRERWSGNEMSMATTLLEEVITALSAPIPDDVAEMVAGLREHNQDSAAADLLERQQRDNQIQPSKESIDSLINDLKVSQQRIEELQKQVAALEAENRGLRILVDDVVLELYDQEEKT